MSINRIAFYHLETLLWIARLGTFAAAAARLNTNRRRRSSSSRRRDHDRRRLNTTRRPATAIRGRRAATRSSSTDHPGRAGWCTPAGRAATPATPGRCRLNLRVHPRAG